MIGNPIIHAIKVMIWNSPLYSMNELQRDMRYQVKDRKADTKSQIAMKKMSFNQVVKRFSSTKINKKACKKS